MIDRVILTDDDRERIRVLFADADALLRSQMRGTAYDDLVEEWERRVARLLAELGPIAPEHEGDLGRLLRGLRRLWRALW